MAGNNIGGILLIKWNPRPTGSGRKRRKMNLLMPLLFTKLTVHRITLSTVLEVMLAGEVFVHGHGLGGELAASISDCISWGGSSLRGTANNSQRSLLSPFHNSSCCCSLMGDSFSALFAMKS